MKNQQRGAKAIIQKRIKILKERGYRGFQLSNEKGAFENTIEVGARSKTGIMIIAIGKTIEEAYENLIERIDQTLDG